MHLNFLDQVPFRHLNNGIGYAKISYTGENIYFCRLKWLLFIRVLE